MNVATASRKAMTLRFVGRFGFWVRSFMGAMECGCSVDDGRWIGGDGVEDVVDNSDESS